MKKMLIGSLIVNGILLGVFGYILVLMPVLPKNTPPMLRFLLVNQTNSYAMEIPADNQR